MWLSLAELEREGISSPTAGWITSQDGLMMMTMMMIILIKQSDRETEQGRRRKEGRKNG